MAQLVAHLLCKQGVGGSSPPGSTRNTASTWEINQDPTSAAGPDEGLAASLVSGNSARLPALLACYDVSSDPVEVVGAKASSAERTSGALAGSAM